MWNKGISLTVPSIEGQLAIAGAMFLPAISSIIVRRLRGEWFEDAGLKWGPRRLYLQTYVVILAIFVAAYGMFLLLSCLDFTTQCIESKAR